MNPSRTAVTLILFLGLVAVGVVLAQSEAPEAEPDDALMERARSTFEPIPVGPPDLEGNPHSAEKEELGKQLFFDPRLSRSWAISCNSCHNMGMAGVDLQPLSLGHGWQRGGRNSPTVLNSVFNIAQFWDGRAPDLAEQAMGPIQDALEMNSTPERVIRTLSSMPGYVEAFAEAFPDDEEPVDFENVALAIEVFESTLLTPNAPFDEFLRGDAQALSDQERSGLDLFMSRGCAGCHGGINLGGHGYYPFGVVERPEEEILPREDVGRFAITDVEADRYAFKSPTLRNVELTPPYFHSGVVWELEEAVRIMGSAQLGAELADEEVADITAFLRTLTGDQPQVTQPVLPQITDRTPQPEPMMRP